MSCPDSCIDIDSGTSVKFKSYFFALKDFLHSTRLVDGD